MKPMDGLQLHRAGIEIDGRWLVRGASLTLRAGSLTALVGPNGSGKSTLLRMLAGLWSPSEGEVTIDGRALSEFDRRTLARRLAFVPQDTHLDFEFTVRDVVAMGRHAHQRRFQRENADDQQAIESALRRADIAHLSERIVTELSGGERQRVILARALATEAATLLLDEPTASLDIAHALDALELCRQLAHEGKSIALATHDLNAAARYADQVVLVSAGAIRAVGAPGAALTDALIQEVFGVQTARAVTAGGEEGFIFKRR